MTMAQSGDRADADGFATPPNYVGWAAVDKARWLWDDLIRATEHTPVSRPDLVMAKPWSMAKVALIPRVLQRTLDRNNDIMEVARPKIIHTQGTVAMVEFVTFEASQFTGVLGPPGSGGAVGLLRMSLAIPPKGKKSVTPGIGLKLLVDGAVSLDVLAMNHTVGQGRDVNLFSNSFSHDLRPEHAELRAPQKLMAYLFKRVAPEPRHLTIDHLAAVTSAGTAVAEPVVPARLVLRPHDDVRRVFRGHHDEDYRVTLGRVQAGTRLYTVDAVGAGLDGSPLSIGEIRLTTRFVSSAGGDRLFFKHAVASDNRVRS